MRKITKYGWIVGLACLPLGGLQMYWYFSNTGPLGLGHLILGLFALTAGTINLAVYAAFRN